MKIKLSLPKKASSSAAMSAAVSITCLGLTQQAEAGVTWIATDDGTDLTLTTSGSFNAGGRFTDDTPTTFTGGSYSHNSFNVYASTGSYYSSGGANVSVPTPPDPWITFTHAATIVTGHTFGHFTGNLLWDTSFGSTPDVITPISSITFPGLTVATAFGSNLDSGPVVIYNFQDSTSGATIDTISVALVSLVPEPSSTALLGLGGLALILRRRRS